MPAVLLPNGKQQFIDINGKPLVGGTVGMFIPNTLIRKDTWEDSAQTVLNTNPIILDSRGQALIYGDGIYRQILRDKEGNLIWDELTEGGTCGAMGYTDVTCYGASGNGTTDDTASIQRAINAAPSGGVVFFPPASTSFKVTQTLTVSKPLTFMGTGPLHLTTTGVALFEGTASGITFDGLTLQGAQFTSYNGFENAIYVHGTFHAGLAPTNITNFTARNLKISGFGAAGIQLNYCNGLSITGNTISQLPYAGIVILSGLNGNVSGNYISEISGTGVGGNNAYGVLVSRETGDAGELTSQPRSAFITVDGNTINGIPTWVALDTHSGFNIAFSNNVIANTYFGIAIGSSRNSAGIDYTYAPLGCSASNNIVNSTVSNGTRSTGISVTGAPVENASGCTISGNTITGYGISTSRADGGILAYYTKGLTISGNSVIEPSPNGIVLAIGAIGTTISGNSIIDPWTNDAGLGGVNGVLITSNNNSPMIGSNTFRQVDRSAIYLLNTATGVGVRYDSGSGNSGTIGINQSNATFYLIDPDLITSATLYDAKTNMPGLPTSDPHVVNQLWNNSGILTVSAG